MTFAMYPSLKDRAVLVTGGGSGIGASIVEHFCTQGSRVAFLDIDRGGSETLVARIAEGGNPAPLFMPCDLTDIGALRAAVGAVQAALGPIRVLVNNAANDDRHDVMAVEPDYWRNRLAVNLDHQFFAAQAVFPGMHDAGGGSIVNFSSIAWKLKVPNLVAYETAKAGIVGMTKSLARDFGSAGVRVNAVLPGQIITERQLALWLDEETLRRGVDLQCIQSPIQPSEVARLVLFLAADDSAMCTGQEFTIDGGCI